MTTLKTYRNPHTAQEMRAWYAAIEQGVKPRARRSPRRLPHSWSDRPIHRTSYENRLRGVIHLIP